MEHNFNINKVIERYKLDTEDVAIALFPHVRYKKQALDRVIKGEACINTDQLQELAKLAGVFVHDLFTIDDWKGSSEDGCLIFIKDDYKVKLNYKGVFVSIYKGPELIYQEFVLNNMTIIEFVEHIDKIINKQI